MKGDAAVESELKSYRDNAMKAIELPVEQDVR